MTPAVRTALAYCYATGNVPKGVHGVTWSAVYALTYRHRATDYRVSAEVLEEVRRHPLAKAHDYLTALGFERESYQRRTSHYVTYRHPRYSCEAGAGRRGSVWITRINDERPYRQTWRVEPETVAAAR